MLVKYCYDCPYREVKYDGVKYEVRCEVSKHKLSMTRKLIPSFCPFRKKEK